ncbi:hypothetical protein ACMGE6_12480 (plasmid) [Macrococcus equi]|uniref:hypothetical protein n=1 Tax=Macrococcus equi TaxID=3395462 RepID=UPI0039BDEA54
MTMNTNTKEDLKKELHEIYDKFVGIEYDFNELKREYDQLQSDKEDMEKFIKSKGLEDEFHEFY